MLFIICTKKEKTRVFLFFNFHKMMLIIIKSENCSYTGICFFFAIAKKVLDVISLLTMSKAAIE